MSRALAGTAIGSRGSLVSALHVLSIVGVLSVPWPPPAHAHQGTKALVILLLKHSWLLIYKAS